MSFVPPGFKQELNVKFPDSRLAVCEKCKKNFKTRDMCRVRNTHTTAPWTTAYICITIDDSCLDEDGNYLDKPMTVRMVQWQPFCLKKSFGTKTPVCAACKRTNRTRSFCRERHKHRHLPWCTVYVLLSSLDSADPSTVVAAPSTKVSDVAGANGEDAGREGKSGDDDQDASKPAAAEDKAEADTVTSDPNDEGDDINDIAESRTFLAKVSSRAKSIHWLELADFDSTESAAVPSHNAVDPPMMAYHPAMGGAPPGMDPSQASQPYYGHGMGYAAQQHQNALKSRQQYFFQMQQQQYAPHHAPWQHQAGSGYNPSAAQGEAGQSPTAGEAAAAQQQQQQQWGMYYPQGNYAPPSHEGGMQAQQGISPEGQEHYHPGQEDGEAGEPDGKRQRV